MMKADVGASIERDRLVRHLDLPQGDNLVAVRDERRGIFRPLANDAPPQAIAEEAAGALEISDAQTDVIDAACGRCGVLCHGILLWCADLVKGSAGGSLGPDSGGRFIGSVSARLCNKGICAHPECHFTAENAAGASSWL